MCFFAAEGIFSKLANLLSPSKVFPDRSGQCALYGVTNGPVCGQDAENGSSEVS